LLIADLDMLTHARNDLDSPSYSYDNSFDLLL